MSRLATITEEDASDEVRGIFTDFQEKMGFPFSPNFIKVQGHSPAVLKGTWALLEHLLLEGQLPRSVKEMVLVAVSARRECKYCEAAHILCCQLLGIDEDTLQAVVHHPEKIEPVRLRDMVLFAIKCAQLPQELEESDFDRLAGHGLSEGEILELIAMASLALFVNTMAEGMHLDIDDEFSSYVT